MSRFIVKRYADIVPYVPGEQPQNMEYNKLNTNESPFPPSPQVIKAISAKEAVLLKLYSDPVSRKLRTAIGEFFNLPMEQVLAGNGSDELLAFCYQAFCDSQNGIAYPDISYGFYPVYSMLYGIDAMSIPLKEDFSVDAMDYVGLGRTILIANPNAPTGMALSRAQIEIILRGNPDNVVIIDEAYVDFGAESVVPLLSQYENLLVIQTCSKSRSLAGMRLGFALGSPELIQDLTNIKDSFNPYNVDRLCSVAGIAAFGDREYFKQCIETIQENRRWTEEALEKLGFLVLPSKANFIFASHPAFSGEAYYLKLKERGILVRHFSKARIKNFVRITIGNLEQMRALIETTRILLEEIQ